MGAFSWLKGGNDRQLAATSYSGPSASETADRKKQAKDRKTRAKDVAKAARAGQAWEDEDRRRERARHG